MLRIDTAHVDLLSTSVATRDSSSELASPLTAPSVRHTESQLSSALAHSQHSPPIGVALIQLRRQTKTSRVAASFVILDSFDVDYRKIRWMRTTFQIILYLCGRNQQTNEDNGNNNR